MKRLIVTLSVTVLTQMATAAVQPGQLMSDASYLRKLSLTLKGTPPDASEYTALAAITDRAKRDAFFADTIKTYQSTTAYRDRMEFRLSELFQVKTRAISLGLGESGRVQIEDRFKGRDSLTDLFGRMATQNLAWDQLLTAKEFNAFKVTYRSFPMPMADFGFWGIVAPQLPHDGSGAVTPDYLKKPKASEAPEIIPVKFAPDDLRIAGALTTARFSSRYNTTALNKNRKRAAAVFKIFLCDAMTPNVSSSGDKHYEFVEATFPEKFEVTEDEIRASVATGADKHGTDADCMACHYKLDPLGKVFQGSALALNGKPSPGALMFTRLRTGELVDVPVKGIGELGSAIAKQPEYANCQVKWFWRQFVGRDAKLTQKRRDELVLKFDSVGRRTNDFVAALVSSDDFRRAPPTPPPPDIVTFDRVEELLQRCDSCHAREQTIPQFSSLPIGGNQIDHEDEVKKMINRLDRAPGDKKKMPKESAGWKQDDIDLVRKWLGQGARDEFGNQTVPGGTP